MDQTHRENDTMTKHTRLYGTWPCAGLCVLLSTAMPVRAEAPAILADPRSEFTEAIADFDQAQQVQATRRDRARKLFASAARHFENVAATGVINGRLEYNLGNCYLQLADIGRAILHYRRAQRLIPGDPLLVDNLKEARSRRLTSIQPRRSSTLIRGLFFPHFTTSIAARTRTALVCFIATWVVLMLRNFVRRRGVTIVAVVCAGTALSLGISVAVAQWSDRNAPAGVITSMDVIAYKGPGSGYQRRFEQPLQPGAEFTLRGRRGGWWSIELPDGKSGWIEAAGADLVRRDTS